MNSSALKPDVRGKQETILVVDDDASVRETLGRVLATEGYVVLPAASGTEALEIAASNRIDLVLLDLNMPGQGGWETFHTLASENPLLAVIIITARPNQLFTSLAAGVDALLEKPFDFPALLKIVRTVIGEPPETRLGRREGRRADFRYLAVGGKRVSPRP